MNIIFLDVDGVLNSSYTWGESITKGEDNLIEEGKVKILYEIYKNTNSLIVLSSSWRKYFTYNSNDEVIPLGKLGRILSNYLNKYGMFIYDMTPRINGIHEDEIDYYLRNHTVSKFLIIDDSVNNKFYPNNTIHTKWDDIKREDCGLQLYNIEQGIEILSRKTKVKHKFFTKEIDHPYYPYGRR